MVCNRIKAMIIILREKKILRAQVDFFYFNALSQVQVKQLRPSSYYKLKDPVSYIEMFTALLYVLHSCANIP